MPTVSLLRTTFGGYEVFNLTGAVLATFVVELDLSSQVDGIATVFAVGVPFVADSLMVFEGGVRQQVGVGLRADPNPGAGTFTFDAAPVITSVVQIWAIKA